MRILPLITSKNNENGLFEVHSVSQLFEAMLVLSPFHFFKYSSNSWTISVTGLDADTVNA